MKDSDGDKMPDSWEQRYPGIDPNVDDAIVDLDEDNLINLDEYYFGTDPTKKDTDGDGYNDGLEIEKDSDPLDPNSVPINKVLLAVIFR